MPPIEDILDGYFPLRVSVEDLLRRRGLKAARLELSFAPIIAVPGLPPEAPVPLNIRSGRAGMIHRAALYAQAGGGLWGRAQWRWLDGAAPEAEFDPMIRLAEPALVCIARADAGDRPTRPARILFDA